MRKGTPAPLLCPPWLLPGAQLSSAPDLLVFPSLPDGEHTAVQPAQHAARILECYRTYCANLTKQFTSKSQAHAQLQRLMERDQWTEVTRTAVGVSHCGLITGNFAAVFTQIGLTPAQISRLAAAIARRAVQDSMNIYCMRLGAKRGLEVQAAHAQPPPPPQPANRRRRRDQAGPAPPSRRTRYTAGDPRHVQRGKASANRPHKRRMAADPQALPEAPPKRRRETQSAGTPAAATAAARRAATAAAARPAAAAAAAAAAAPPRWPPEPG